MRPRGESSSSPSSTKVGHVALQKPQWTQARRIFSASAVARFSSCAREKFVCISNLRPHAARLQNRIRIERIFQPPRECGKPLRLRLEHRDFPAGFGRRADQGVLPAARGKVSSASQTKPPDQSNKVLASYARQIMSATFGPAVGVTEIFQM